MIYHHSKNDASNLCPVSSVPVPEGGTWTSLDRPGFYNTCGACAGVKKSPPARVKNDLLVRLLDAYIAKGSPPDALSWEFREEDKKVICFEWFSGKSLDFPYSKERYDVAWDVFQDYWNNV